ncbi:CLUMA_CG003152, isoform A [Clunio marinus]|uniref:CLUMA_CG003152, isoform A n=1 Tax=Clunio marinus TaxID=568069 RepID=A0A1J1HMW5_9DIPT|nr:CLUMA_CG003152, isoform A [Clunio marinus]
MNEMCIEMMHRILNKMNTEILYVLHAITGETSFDDGMTEDCDVSAEAYEYSKGFVIAISEFKISGVRGVVVPKSTPTPSIGGVDSDMLQLYILFTLSHRKIRFCMSFTEIFIDVMLKIGCDLTGGHKFSAYNFVNTMKSTQSSVSLKSSRNCSGYQFNKSPKNHYNNNNIKKSLIFWENLLVHNGL